MYQRMYPADHNKEEFDNLWNNAKTVRDHLTKLFELELERAYKDEEKVEDLTVAIAAHKVGERKALRKIIDYLRQEV